MLEYFICDFAMYNIWLITNLNTTFLLNLTSVGQLAELFKHQT